MVTSFWKINPLPWRYCCFHVESSYDLDVGNSVVSTKLRKLAPRTAGQVHMPHMAVAVVCVRVLSVNSCSRLPKTNILISVMFCVWHVQLREGSNVLEEDENFRSIWGGLCKKKYCISNICHGTYFLIFKLCYIFQILYILIYYDQT